MADSSLIHLFTSDFHSLPHSLQQEIYDEFYRLVYPRIYYIVQDHGLVEDVIQEAFLRAVEKSSQLQDLQKVEQWLKKLARNVALNVVQKIQRNRNELEESGVLLERTSAAQEAAPDKAVELKMMKETIAAYLEDLKPEYRQVIEMRWIHNMSYKDMAAQLNVTEGTVRQKLFRSREAIRQRLEKEWGIYVKERMTQRRAPNNERK